MSRSYKHNGKTVPSVTTVLGKVSYDYAGLADWEISMIKAGKNPRDKTRYAASVGSAVHKMIESKILGLETVEIPDLTDQQEIEASLFFKGFVRFCSDWSPEFLTCEKQVVNSVYGGTIDAIAIIGGKKFILDFKTSSAVRLNYAIQLAAYNMLLKEDAPSDYGLGVVHLLGDGGYDFVRVNDEKVPKLGQVFMNMLSIYEMLNKETEIWDYTKIEEEV